eukprot:g79865.t1
MTIWHRDGSDDSTDELSIPLLSSQADFILSTRDAEESFWTNLVSKLLLVVGLFLLLVPFVWPFAIRTISQYERVVIFRLGRVQRVARGPGLFVFLPLVYSFKSVDLRMNTINMDSQEMMTKDSVTVHVNGVVFFHCVDPLKVVLCCREWQKATTLLAQTTLRAVVGESELDTLLYRRDLINTRLTRAIDQGAAKWGISVANVVVKDICLPVNMQRAMGQQAEAERVRRAKVIGAEGELQSSITLMQAAARLQQNIIAMQLRYLETLRFVSRDKKSTIVYPLPLTMPHETCAPLAKTSQELDQDAARLRAALAQFPPPLSPASLAAGEDTSLDHPRTNSAQFPRSGYGSGYDWSRGRKHFERRTPPGSLLIN